MKKTHFTILFLSVLFSGIISSCSSSETYAEQKEK